MRLTPTTEAGALRIALGAAVVGLGLALAAKLATASPRAQWETQKTYRAEGNQNIPFAVACSSGHWYEVGVPTSAVGYTVLQSSDVIRRSILMQGVSSNTSGVCVSTRQAVDVTCTDTTNGAEIIGTAALTDYSEAAWYCRCRADAACVLKGYVSRDADDQGDVENYRR